MAEASAAPGGAGPPENDGDGHPAPLPSFSAPESPRYFEAGISSPSSTVSWPEVASSSDELARSLLLLKGGDRLAAAQMLRAALAHLEAPSPDPVTDDATGATLPATMPALPAIEPLPPAAGARLASQSMPTPAPDETPSSSTSAAKSSISPTTSSAPAAVTSLSASPPPAAPPGRAPAAAADPAVPPSASSAPAGASTASGKRARTEAGDRGDGRGAPSEGESAGRARLPRVGINPTTDEIDELRYTLVWLLSPAAAEGVVVRCAEVGPQTGCTLALQTRLQSGADGRPCSAAVGELPLRVSGRLNAVPVAHHLVTQILSAPPPGGGEAPPGITNPNPNPSPNPNPNLTPNPNPNPNPNPDPNPNPNPTRRRRASRRRRACSSTTRRCAT